MSGEVGTTHVQRLLDMALDLAGACDGRQAADVVDYDGQRREVRALLERAANLARHAAEELTDETFTSAGWPS